MASLVDCCYLHYIIIRDTTYISMWPVWPNGYGVGYYRQTLQDITHLISPTVTNRKTSLSQHRYLLITGYRPTQDVRMSLRIKVNLCKQSEIRARHLTIRLYHFYKNLNDEDNWHGSPIVEPGKVFDRITIWLIESCNDVSRINV